MSRFTRGIRKVFGGVKYVGETTVKTTENVVVATGSGVKTAAVSTKGKVTAAFLAGAVAGNLGPGAYQKAQDVINPPTPPPIVETTPPASTPTPPVPDPVPAPAPTPDPVKKDPCYKDVPYKKWFEVREYKKWRDQNGKEHVVPVVHKRYMTKYKQVEVPCEETAAPPPSSSAPLPTNPTSPPSHVQAPAPTQGTVMYGLKGLGGTFDQKAFEDFAKARGYVPKVIKDWTNDEAIAQLKKAIGNSTAPYALYGFSYGAQTAKNWATKHFDQPPSLIVTVGASSILSLDPKNFSASTFVENYFHTGTKHDTPGYYIKAPNVGDKNIQRILADMTMDGTIMKLAPEGP